MNKENRDQKDYLENKKVAKVTKLTSVKNHVTMQTKEMTGYWQLVFSFTFNWLYLVLSAFGELEFNWKQKNDEKYFHQTQL